MSCQWRGSRTSRHFEQREHRFAETVEVGVRGQFEAVLCVSEQLHPRDGKHVKEDKQD